MENGNLQICVIYCNEIRIVSLTFGTL